MDPVVPFYTSPPAEEPASAGVWLDEYHQRLLQRVIDRDTPDAKKELAALFVSRLTDEIHSLRQDQTELGMASQLNAIRASGWTGWARFFAITSWAVVLVDAAIWILGGARLLDIG